MVKNKKREEINLKAEIDKHNFENKMRENDKRDVEDKMRLQVYRLMFHSLQLFEWIRFLWKHPRRRWIPARASWANMLECLDLEPQMLITKMQRADVIPGVLDAPYQNTTLINIGLWCFVLGMKELNIDVTKGTIQARNSYASLLTTQQPVPGVSKVIHIEGNLERLEAMVDEASIM